MRVRLYRRGRSPTQSGARGALVWHLEPELVTSREPECLMGWASAGDPFGALGRALTFASVDEALAFAQRQGWSVRVEVAEARVVVPRNYRDTVIADSRPRTGG